MGAYCYLLTSVEYGDNMYVGALGDVDMLIRDTGENIAVGDLLIASATPGYARKDPGTYRTTYAIARATKPVDWPTATDYIDQE